MVYLLIYLSLGVLHYIHSFFISDARHRIREAYDDTLELHSIMSYPQFNTLCLLIGLLFIPLWIIAVISDVINWVKQ